MKKQKGAVDLVGGLMVVGFLAVIYVAFYGFNAFGCWRDWSDSKMNWKTSFALTCKVEHPTMGWIPARKVRGTD